MWGSRAARPLMIVLLVLVVLSLLLSMPGVMPH
jgi:hypothetical protein